MAALSLRGAANPARAAQVLDVRNHDIAEYFISEVLERQAPDVARFMLEVSILGEMTAGACAAVTGRDDAAALLRGMDAANLFVVALDDERTSFRYHRLVRQILRAELRSRDRPRERSLQSRRLAGSNQLATPGTRPGISWRPSSPTGRWRSCKSGSYRNSCATPRCRRRCT